VDAFHISEGDQLGETFRVTGISDGTPTTPVHISFTLMAHPDVTEDGANDEFIADCLVGLLTYAGMPVNQHLRDALTTGFLAGWLFHWFDTQRDIEEVEFTSLSLTQRFLNQAPPQLQSYAEEMVRAAYDLQRQMNERFHADEP
jgi:hypothetical protein